MSEWDMEAQMWLLAAAVAYNGVVRNMAWIDVSGFVILLGVFVGSSGCNDFGLAVPTGRHVAVVSVKDPLAAEVLPWRFMV